MHDRSSDTPPKGALTWPSSEVPVPNGITGTRASAQSFTTSTTSGVLSANSTASGGCVAIQVNVLACCSRNAVPVEKRLPNRVARRANRVRLASAEGRSTASAMNALMAALYHPCDSRKVKPLG